MQRGSQSYLQPLISKASKGRCKVAIRCQMPPSWRTQQPVSWALKVSPRRACKCPPQSREVGGPSFLLLLFPGSQTHCLLQLRRQKETYRAGREGPWSRCGFCPELGGDGRTRRLPGLCALRTGNAQSQGWGLPRTSWSVLLLGPYICIF